MRQNNGSIKAFFLKITHRLLDDKTFEMIQPIILRHMSNLTFLLVEVCVLYKQYFSSSQTVYYITRRIILLNVEACWQGI